MTSIVIMGVAGCGKSSLGQALSLASGLTLVEGDDHHSQANRQKMQAGIALTDEDRDGWLSTLGNVLRQHPEGLVVTCSALKRAYRERLRQASPDLRFVFLYIARDAAHTRVSGRGSTHFFPASLIDKQFETLESPVGEPGVLRLDALQPLHELQREVSLWLGADPQA
jgi:gluconokinase